MNISPSFLKKHKTAIDVSAAVNIESILFGLIQGFKEYCNLATCLTLLLAILPRRGILQKAASRPTLASVGRVIVEIGVRMVSNASKHLQGIMISLFELFLDAGGMLAVWTTYGYTVYLTPIAAQRRAPLSLQVGFAAIVKIPSFIIPESSRWPAEQDGHHKATTDIYSLLHKELGATQGRTICEVLERRHLLRLLWGLGIGSFAMWRGHIAILYYGPTDFAQISYTGQNAALIASGVFTCIKFASTVLFIVGCVHVSKRKTLMARASWQWHRVIIRVRDDSPYLSLRRSVLSDLGTAAVDPYRDDFPTHIRGHGMNICAGHIELSNFVVSKITPLSILQTGWKTWMLITTSISFAYRAFSPHAKRHS
ncbi:hypothetical protein BJ170DRAFT_704626 [Xylariales sp. AK1849]|nr:hypothetical protein BJ170DRAFT_704626 [Xylariales sp. AK1849]